MNKFPEPETPSNIEEEKNIVIEEEFLKELQIQNRLLEAELEEKTANIEERKKYAAKIFNLISWYYISVGLIIILNIILPACPFFEGKIKSLNDNVIIVLLSGSLINTVSMFIIVAKYLFPKTNPKVYSGTTTI
ncbi:MAG: hypothetical protein V4591_10535 [Bdellovibrionota bacterium]